MWHHDDWFKVWKSHYILNLRRRCSTARFNFISQCVLSHHFDLIFVNELNCVNWLNNVYCMMWSGTFVNFLINPFELMWIIFFFQCNSKLMVLFELIQAKWRIENVCYFFGRKQPKSSKKKKTKKHKKRFITTFHFATCRQVRLVTLPT